MFKKEFEKFWSFYMKNYKKLMVIPIILVLFFGGVLIYNKMQTGEFIEKDISLTGGTTITVSTREVVELSHLEERLKEEFGTEDLSVRVLTETFGRAIVGYDIQTGVELETREVYNSLSEIFTTEISDQTVSTGFQGPTLGQTFFRDIMYILAFSFVLVALASFYYFRNFYTSSTIIISSAANVICILGIMNLFGIKFNITTIGALLIMISYSTDSNILLSTNIIKRKEGSLSYRLRKALKTELTQDLSSYTVYITMFLVSRIDIIQHIAIILIMGIFFDEIFTLILNNGLQRMWVEKNENKTT